MRSFGQPGTLIFAVCALALIAAAIKAAPQTQPAEPLIKPTTHPVTQSAAELPALIAQLSSPRWKERIDGLDRLVELGDLSLPELESVRARTANIDLRARIELAMSRIAQSGKSGPSYVTVHLTSGTVREAFDAIAAQSHLTFDPGMTAAGGPATIALDADHKPMWRVLREVCAAAKLQVTAIDELGHVTLQGSDESWGTRPASVQGPYMLVARRIEMARSIDFARPKDVTNAYTLTVLAYVEPRMHPIYWAVRSIDQCVTDTGQQLEQQQNEPWEAGELNTETETHFTFSAPADAGRRLAKLRLTARFVLSDQSQRLDVANVLNVKNQKQNVGGWQVEIKGVTKTDDTHYTATLSVHRENHDPDEWTERMELLDRVQPKLIDTSGKPIEISGSSFNESPDEWTWSDEIGVTGNEKPAKLQWDFPIQTRHVDVSFEFKDLPLP